MANNQELQDIISASSRQSIDEAKAKSDALNKSLQETILLRKQLNDTMAGAKTMGDINKVSQQEQAALEKTNKLIAQRQLAEEKLAAFQKSQADKQAAIEAKQLAVDEAKIARIKRIEEADAARAKRSADASAAELANNKQATDAETSYAAAISGTTKQETQRQKVKKLSNLDQEKANQLAKIDRANLIAAAKEGNAVKGSLEQRQLALARLQKTYSELSAEERNSPFGQRLAKTIPQLNDQVLSLEKSLGKSQLNVVNYTSAIGSAASKAFGVIRTAANILPGIGIAGIFGLALDPLLEYISKLDLFKTKIQDVAASGGALSSEYKKANGDVAALGVTLEEYKKGTISRKEVVDRYNESIGKTVGELKSVGEIEDFYNKKSEAFVKATLLRSQAQSALNVATEKTSEALARQIEGPTIGDTIKGTFSNIFSIISNLGRAGQIGVDVFSGSVESQKNGIKDLKKEANDAFNEYKKLQKQADEFAKSNGLSFRTNPKDPKAKDTSKERSKQARDDAAALVQVEIDAAKQIAEIYKKQAENVNFSEETRLESLQKYSDKAIEIADLEADKEFVGKVLSAKELLAVDSKRQADRAKIATETTDLLLKIEKDLLDQYEVLRESYNKRQLNELAKNRDERLLALESLYSKQLISQEQYDKRKDELTKQALRIEIEKQIRQAEEILKIRQKQGFDISQQEAELAALRLKYQQIEVDGVKKVADEKKKVYDKEKELLQEVFNFGRQLVSNLFESRVNALEGEKKLAEDRKNIEIENVNESVASEEDKKERIAVIEAKAANDQALLDAKIREQKRRQAIADKAAAIAQAFINIALAQTKTLATTGFLGIPLNAVIAAIGAVQIASIIAQPLPKFATGKGKGNNYEGAAWVGDGGMNELVINKDGSAWVTPDKPTLTYVGKDTEVISGPEFARMRMMAKPDQVQYEGKSWDVDRIVRASENSAKQMTKAVSKIKLYSTVQTEKGFRSHSTNISKFNQRMKNTFGW